MSDARSTHPDTFQNVRLPVAMMAKDFAAARELAPHRHRRAQLIFALSGVMRVTAGDATWVLPPHRALWVPPNVEHALSVIGTVRMRTLYVDPTFAKRRRLPSACGMLDVSPLLRELILSAHGLQLDAAPDARGRRIINLIVAELREVHVAPLALPMPFADAELLALCERMRTLPGSRPTLDAWAAELHLSGKSLARRFLAQTGLTFGAWRTRACVLEALARLAAGSSVTAVALDLGYESPSAFTAMFKRATGTTPSRYFRAGASSYLAPDGVTR